MSVLPALVLALAAWALPVFFLPAASQAQGVRHATVAIPQTLMIPPPAELKAAFPQGVTPGMGFGLNCALVQADGAMVLHTLTGRGPVLDGPRVPGVGGVEPSEVFVLPRFNPAIVTLKLANGKAETLGMIPLRGEDGQPVSGLPPAPGPKTPSTPQTRPLSLGLAPLAASGVGIDPQGVAYDAKRNAYWIVDGYRPALMRVQPRDGRVLSILAPGEGLEDYLATRRVGYGLSGTSVSPGGKVYSIMRGPLAVNGVSGIFSRILEYDPDSERLRQLPYPIEDAVFADVSAVETCEPVAIADKKVLVLEQGLDKQGKPRSLVFLADLNPAHNINRVYNDKNEPPEVMTDLAQWRRQDLRMAKKTLVLDLHEAGFTSARAESMTLLSDGRTLAVMTGHGFGLEGQLTGYAAGTDGKPQLDPAAYTLGPDGKLSLDGKPTAARLEVRPSREAPMLWLVTLPRKASEY